MCSVYSAAATGIFAARNAGRFGNGETGRGPVAAAQGVCLFDSILKLDSAAAKLASKSVNPLICVSSGIKIAKSDDKLAETMKEVTALSTMFAAEKGIKELSPRLLKMFNINLPGIADDILRGAILVGTSIAAYSAGHAMGTDLAKDVSANSSIA